MYTKITQLPQDLVEYLENLTNNIDKTLSENLYGVYLYGSISYGDFEETTSDVDIFVITKTRLSDHEISSLSKMFENPSFTENRWFKRLEIDFFTVLELSPLVDNELITVRFAGEKIKSNAVMHGASIDLANLRECGINLLGPPASVLIPTIENDLIHQALRDKFYELKSNAPKWSTINLWNQAFIVIQLCRVVCRFKTQQPCSKRKAGTWCMENLPPIYKPIIAEALDKLYNYNGSLSEILSQGIPTLFAYTETLFG